MTLQVLVEKTDSGLFRAVTSQPFTLSAEADSPTHAVRQLREALEKRLVDCQVIELELPTVQAPNPWLNYTGIWKTHPDFDTFREAVTDYRAAVDASQQ